MMLSDRHGLGANAAWESRRSPADQDVLAEEVDTAAFDSV